MGIKIGIDLGTTFSAVAVYDEESGRPVMVKNQEGEWLTPSVIQFADDEIIIGSEAKDSYENGENGCVSVFKRRMGDPSPYCVAGGKNYSAQDLSAILLRYLKESTEKITGQRVDEAVVTVPAYFYQQERAATLNAAKTAGLNVRQIINEPSAAAMTYALSHWRKNAKIMVYDLGGGTFDVTILQMSDMPVMRSLKTTGNHMLGGKDWDDLLIRLICDKIFSETGTDLRSVPAAYKAVERQAETLKKSLTQLYSTSVTVMLPEQGRYKITVTVDEFNEYTRPLLERTGSLCRNLLGELNMSWDDLTDILLVGGSTRMKQVPAYLEEISGHTPISHVNPDEAVAMGAAIQVNLPVPDYKEVSLRTVQDTAEVRQSAAEEETELSSPLSLRYTDIVAHAMGIIAVNDEGTYYINKQLSVVSYQL